MIISDIGIVLGSVNYKHSSRILKVYTQQHGIVSFFVSIQKKNNILAFSQPLFPVNLTYSTQTKSVNLYQLKEISTLFPLANVYGSIKKTAVVFFLAEIILLTIKEEAANTNLFNFLKQSLQELEENDFYDGFVIEFLAQITIFLGIEPLLEEGKYFNLQTGELQNNYEEYTCLSPELSLIFIQLFKEFSSISFKSSQKQNLLNALLLYFQYQVPNFKNPKSLEIIREVFS